MRETIDLFIDFFAALGVFAALMGVMGYMWGYLG
jgi:hypothetical protein